MFSYLRLFVQVFVSFGIFCWLDLAFLSLLPGRDFELTQLVHELLLDRHFAHFGRRKIRKPVLKKESWQVSLKNVIRGSVLISTNNPYLVFKYDVTSKLFSGWKAQFFTERTENGVIVGVKVLEVCNVLRETLHITVATFTGPAYI